MLFSHKKKENMTFATWMDLKGIMLSEVSQTEKETHITYITLLYQPLQTQFPCSYFLSLLCYIMV